MREPTIVQHYFASLSDRPEVLPDRGTYQDPNLWMEHPLGAPA